MFKYFHFPIITILWPIQAKLNHFSWSWCVSISALKGLTGGTVYFYVTCNDIIGFPAARWAESKNISTFPKIFMTNVIFSGFLLNNFNKFTKQKLFLVKNWLGKVPSRAAVETFKPVKTASEGETSWNPLKSSSNPYCSTGIGLFTSQMVSKVLELCLEPSVKIALQIKKSSKKKHLSA